MIERTGIVEEGERRRALYSRHQYVAPHDRLGEAWPKLVARPKAKPVVQIVAAEDVGIPIRPIMTKFCELYSAASGEPYTLAHLASPERSMKLARPRHVCMLLVRQLTGRSYPEIAMPFHRDHTSVMSGCKRAILHIAEDTQGLRQPYVETMKFFTRRGP